VLAEVPVGRPRKEPELVWPYTLAKRPTPILGASLAPAVTPKVVEALPSEAAR